jgi:aryl-alcohol dehydrogenase-like predicted oxidoreductase
MPLPSRRFGRLGWRIWPLGLGAAWLRGRRGDRELDEAAQFVFDALSAGVDYVDTAPLYGDSELVLGLALAELPAERRPRLATKAGIVPRDAWEWTADWVLRSATRSLERLRVDHIDVLQLHECNLAGWDRVMGRGGCLEGLQQARNRGWCTAIGITGRQPELLARLLRTGEFDSVLSYSDYDLTTAEAARTLLPAAAAHDVAVVLGSPLRGGSLAHRAAEAWRYLLSDPRVAVVLAGAASIEELTPALAAAEEGPLQAAGWAALRTSAEPPR